MGRIHVAGRRGAPSAHRHHRRRHQHGGHQDVGHVTANTHDAVSETTVSSRRSLARSAYGCHGVGARRPTETEKHARAVPRIESHE